MTESLSEQGMAGLDPTGTDPIKSRVARTVQITFDCADPNALAGFWNEVLGYEYDAPPSGFSTWHEALDELGVPPEEHNRTSASVDPAGNGPRLYFQRVAEPKSAKNRVNRDVRAAPDRKSVVKGKWWYARVDIGGSRRFHKKKQYT